jgi:hypothetical protein
VEELQQLIFGLLGGPDVDAHIAGQPIGPILQGRAHLPGECAADDQSTGKDPTTEPPQVRIP